MHARRTAAFWLTASLFASIANADDSTFDLDIPAQSLKQALGALAEQTGLQVVYQADIADGLSSPAVKGELTATEALARMLRGTGLDSRFLSERAIAISTPSRRETGATKVNMLSTVPLRLAQANSDMGVEIAQPLPPEPLPASVELEEILVTGSHIRGAANIGAPLTVLTREDMDRTGYATVQDILKTVSSNTGGGPTDEPLGGVENDSNFGGGSSVSLRGLGASSTLVLVDGRRMANTGTEARFTDVSTIPMAAIDRIEILEDGASAIYGSDAIGGVVNIILRKDFSGAETRARYASPASGADETTVGQLLGKAWNGGHAMVAYEYWNRDALAFADRRYSADTDKRSLGGTDMSLFYSNPGNIADPATGLPAFAIPAGQDGRSLMPADLIPGVVNTGNLFEGAELIPSQEMHAAFMSVSQRVGNRAELHLDGNFSRRTMTRRSTASTWALNVPSSNPYFVDPFGGSSDVTVYYQMIDDIGNFTVRPVNESYGATVGGTIDLARDWQLDLDVSSSSTRIDYLAWNAVDFPSLVAALADSNPSTAFNPFGDGSYTNPATLDSIRSVLADKVDTDVRSATALFQGSLFSLPGGEVKMAVGTDYREEELTRIRRTTGGGATRIAGRLDVGRQITAGFAELQIPIIGAENQRKGINDLRLSLAGRLEKYSDFGTTTNPKFAIGWKPSQSVQVRASFGTAFKAPNLHDLEEDSDFRPSGASLAVVPDPASPAGQSSVLLLTGNNANLREETATTWTAGIDLLPGTLAGLTASFTYFDIDFEHRIQRGGPNNVYDIFRAEYQWAPIITRDPSSELLAALCSRPGLQVTQQQCLNSGVAAVVDMRMRNLGVVHVRGVDAKFRYSIPTSLGSWDLKADASYLLSFDQSVTKTSPAEDIVDTLNGPVSLRIRGGVSWAYHNFAADLAIQHQDSYRDELSQPARKIDALTTVDFRVAYTFPDVHSFTRGTEIGFAVLNAFDQDPPFVNNFYGYDTANADPLGRVFSFQITKAW